MKISLSAGLVTILISFYSIVTLEAAVGDLYVADFSANTVSRFTPAGAQTTFASDLNGPEGLAFDSKGNFFVTDTGSGSIFKFAPNGTKTTFSTGLNGPASAVFDASGNLFDADFFGNTIVKIAPDGTKTTFASGLNGPNSLTFDSAGNLFAADFGRGSIVKFAPNGAQSTFAAGLNHPHGLAFDAAGNLFEGDFGSGRIFKFTSSGARSTFAMGLNGPHGLAFDRSGNLFEVDYTSGTVFRFTPDGAKTTFASGMTNPDGLVIETPTAITLNISTRAQVLTDDKVLIGGLIIKGTDDKRVIVRGIGPSLSNFGVAGALQDPLLELHDSAGGLVASNDDWRDAQVAEIQMTGLAPSDIRESAIVRTLSPGAWTVIVRGKNSTTGVGLVEVYDLNAVALSDLANISTRAFVGTGENVLIGGFIVGGGDGAIRVVFRAIGPSLAQFGVNNPLADPKLDIHDGNGLVIASNDNWKEAQQAEIQMTGLAPQNDLESALVTILGAGNYTAVVSGVGNSTGVALVEAYNFR
jgi:sugar lactone lactonase YvrE